LNHRFASRAIDYLAVAAFPFAIPFLSLSSSQRLNLRHARRLQDIIRVTVLRNDFYEPTIGAIERKPRGPRELPGIDFNLAKQKEVLRRFSWASELIALHSRQLGHHRIMINNDFFAEGDAEALYSFVRTFKPRTAIEVGAGFSTTFIQCAAKANAEEDPKYTLRHICFEPYRNPWLESLGPVIRRERVEDADLALFRALQPNDILLIDSSHILRTQGDVESEILRIVPSVAPGVLVHFHDIFSPRDYPDAWIHDRRLLWNEQYAVEAFLSFNSSFEIVLALNYLHHLKEPDLYRAFPLLEANPSAEPGSLWIRRHTC
jgi:hypothetical protein